MKSPEHPRDAQDFFCGYALAEDRYDSQNEHFTLNSLWLVAHSVSIAQMSVSITFYRRIQALLLEFRTTLVFRGRKKRPLKERNYG